MKKYVFAKKLNGTEETGIVIPTNPPELICLCTEEKSKLILDALNKKEITKDEASIRACELLRKHFINENHPNINAYDDKYIINNYPDEWGWPTVNKNLRKSLQY